MSNFNPHGRQSRRNSSGGTNTSGERALSGLQRLSSHTQYPLTPSRRIISGTLPAQRSASRYTPGRRTSIAPSTPHGLRARQQRDANTPARDRRRSGRLQRETTFDILRNLGKALAPVSQPIQSSPTEIPQPVEEPEDEIEELDNEPEIELPRLSLPIEEVEEESNEHSPEMRPPRMSLALEEDDITYQSIEYPRRDLADRDRDRLSTISRLAGRISGDFGETQPETDDEDDNLGTPGHDDGAETSGDEFDGGGETEDLGRFQFDLNFPSPSAPVLEDPVVEPSQDLELDSFELAPPDVQLMGDSPRSDDDSDFIGGLELGLNPAPAEFPSPPPGNIGGGLRDENDPVQGNQKMISRHGIPVPNLPANVIRKVATRFARTGAGSSAKLNRAALAAIQQASSWFFEQASQDLVAYANHAGRKTIDENDVTTLMKRQRHINNSTTMFSLAQKHLPKELHHDMRLAMPQ